MGPVGEFEKISITKFRGLYKRGLADECPQDHAICCENVVFNKKGEVSSRPGISPSFFVNHDVRRMFQAINNGGSQLITCDGVGNIYQDSNPTPIFTSTGVYDFAGYNMFGFTFILPIMSDMSTPPKLQIWDGITATTRNAAGLAPTASFSAADGAAGNVDVGDYLIAVSFVTASAFVTQPGPKIATVFTPVAYTAPGAKKINLTGLPLGPAGTIARQIFITKANQQLYFYVGQDAGGYIGDNTTTTATLNFFDTDLAISADDLFDQLETIPGSNITGTMTRYHNRLAVVTFSHRVLMSGVSNAESFNAVTGFFNTPGEVTNNYTVFSVVVQRDVLYAIRFPGIFAVEDNGQEPVFWPVVKIDGGIGSGAPGIGTISADENAASSSELFLLSDFGGIFIFDGAVRRPALTWKIEDLWKSINWKAFFNISLFIDVYHDTFYVLVPVGDSTLPNLLLVADYSEGMDAENIKWSIFTFPFTPSSIALFYLAGNLDAGDVYYYLHLAFYGNTYIYKTHLGYVDDIGAAINAYYQCYLATSQAMGNVQIFRMLRFRGKGSGDLNILLDAEDFDPALEVNPPPITLADPMSKDLDRQINYTGEKMSVGFGTSSFVNNPIPGEYFTVGRLDIFVKSQFKQRPG